MTKIFDDPDAPASSAPGLDIAQRFELTVDGETAGFIEYHAYGKLAIVTHTEVHSAYEGRGVGSELARQASQFFRNQGWRVVPVCGFYANYLRKHPDDAALATPAARRIFDL